MLLEIAKIIDEGKDNTDIHLFFFDKSLEWFEVHKILKLW